MEHRLRVFEGDMLRSMSGLKEGDGEHIQSGASQFVQAKYRYNDEIVRNDGIICK
jgi:hypothetical protein